jgi:hypothetical protein
MVSRSDDGRSCAIGLFFALVLVGLLIAAVVDAPLTYDGALFFYTVLDFHQYADFHYRYINDVVQFPMLAATHLTHNARILRLIFSSGYAAVPALGLAASWLACRRRPSLFIWSAVSICVANLPGQFSFQSEAIMAVTLMWPAVLALLAEAPPIIWPMVAATSIAASISHPCVVVPLAFVIILSAVLAFARPRSRAMSLLFGVFAVILLVRRSMFPFDAYETTTFNFNTISYSFNVAVLGWPLVAIVSTCAAASALLRPSRRYTRIVLVGALLLSGVTLMVWAIDPTHWWKCADFRTWVAPVSLIFMAAAAFDVLWPPALSEAQLENGRRFAFPVIGAIFFVVISIQSLLWHRMSTRLTDELLHSGSGCVPSSSFAWLRHTAMDHWATTIYATDLQALRPRTLMLPDAHSCETFARTGVVTFVDQGFSVTTQTGEGRFNFDDARNGTSPAN